MREYITEAVVLDREPHAEQDARVIFFTEQFGKLSARARSLRKITSKLSGHFQPGNIVTVRFVEKRGLQVIDGLTSGKNPWEPPDLLFLSRLLVEAEPDPEIWHVLLRPVLWEEVLAILGWGPKGATCVVCGGNTPCAFYIREPSFFCKVCASKLPAPEVIYVER